MMADFWDGNEQKDAPTPVPGWKRGELRRRKQRYLQCPASGRTWEQVKQWARARHGLLE